ncbi:MAG: c-type cytochrome [Thermus sp.]|uniref:c-type cytochrome n=1 Tax=unclassified Thermus TaxID=2619321 RepID=UPI0002389B8E|nr:MULTISPECIES: c-type cytochrome [unclassified Thermus]AEV15378.1 Cytochrome c [Thermus sp. CCB_US3_UF1]MCS6867996.1 c-type cytochrome [Thermus sp.]MCS7218590.1 c-type cytochrome [Thermus sp.]MDW8016917.1 c-type cytochrome [Thermus sp.]MDW8357088.1 c-type cytochrome [Thermus sp.]
MVVDRIEVYLDGAAEPLAVLKEPPYRLNLDTKKLPDGEHTLRVVTHFRGGGQEIREIPFTVNNYPDILVLGLDEGGEVAGQVELRLAVGEPELPVEPIRFNPLWYVVASVVVLGGIWSYFALSPAAEKIVAEVAPPAQESQAHGATGAQPAANVDPALLEKGKAVYEAHCAACHQANGQGMPPAMPALAGNANLKDAQMILNIVKNGRGAMPPVGAAFSEEEVKAVATYIRNSFGNSFGPVE